MKFYAAYIGDVEMNYSRYTKTDIIDELYRREEELSKMYKQEGDGEEEKKYSGLVLSIYWLWIFLLLNLI